eukprot:40428_1
MSNNDGINIECCESVIEDLLNIINDNTAVELRWTVPVSLYDIETLFLKTSLKSHFLTLETHISRQRNSITIIPIINDNKHVQMRMLKRTKHKQLSLNFVQVTYQNMTYGFIHQIEKQYKYSCVIPVDIIHLCCKFSAPELKYEYVDMTQKTSKKQITPLDLLFGIFRSEPGISSNNSLATDIQQQVQYLEDSNFNLAEPASNSLPVSQTISNLLSIYHQYAYILSRSIPLNLEYWGSKDLVVSLIHFLINTTDFDKFSSKTKTRTHPKTWEFMGYFWKYCCETKYDGETFLNEYQSTLSNSKSKGIGLQKMKAICTKYSLKSGPFSKIKKAMDVWAKKLWTSFLVSVDHLWYEYANNTLLGHDSTLTIPHNHFNTVQIISLLYEAIFERYQYLNGRIVNSYQCLKVIIPAFVSYLVNNRINGHQLSLMYPMEFAGAVVKHNRQNR